jgi:hypothetical protein
VADPVGRSVVDGWTGTPYARRSKHQRELGYPTVGRCRTGRSALSLVSSEGHRDERRFGVTRRAGPRRIALRLPLDNATEPRTGGGQVDRSKIFPTVAAQATNGRGLPTTRLCSRVLEDVKCAISTPAGHGAPGA